MLRPRQPTMVAVSPEQSPPRTQDAHVVKGVVPGPAGGGVAAKIRAGHMYRLHSGAMRALWPVVPPDSGRISRTADDAHGMSLATSDGTRANADETGGTSLDVGALPKCGTV